MITYNYKTMNISETKQGIEKLITLLELNICKCCSVTIKIGSMVFSLQWHFNIQCVLFSAGDARPHGLVPDNDLIFQGCPSNHDPVAICHEMAARGIILYCVGCEPSLTQYREFFMALSLITGGQYICLRRARLLPRVSNTYEIVI